MPTAAFAPLIATETAAKSVTFILGVSETCAQARRALVYKETSLSVPPFLRGTSSLVRMPPGNVRSWAEKE